VKPTIRVIAVGGLKEQFFLKAQAYYLNELTPLYNISVVELPDEPAPDNLSAAGRQAVLVSEGGRIMSRLTPINITVSLAVEGRFANLSFFSDLIGKAAGADKGLDFIIGGSLGLAGGVLERSDYRISLSRLTFPHRLTRLLLLDILLNASFKGKIRL